MTNKQRGMCSSSRGLACLALALFLAAGFILALPAWAAKGGEPPRQLPSAEDESAADCLQAGQQAMSRREFRQAAQAFAQCARRFPSDSHAHFWQGMAHFLDQQAQPAGEAFRQVLALEPGHVGALAMLGKLYSFEKPRLAEAEQLLLRALRLRPDLEEARFDLARVYALTGRHNRSLEEFQLLFRGEPRFALYHVELGRILASQGQMEAARREMERALALFPGYAPALEQLKALEQAEKPTPSPPAR